MRSSHGLFVVVVVRTRRADPKNRQAERDPTASCALTVTRSGFHVRKQTHLLLLLLFLQFPAHLFLVLTEHSSPHPAVSIETFDGRKWLVLVLVPRGSFCCLFENAYIRVVVVVVVLAFVVVAVVAFAAVALLAPRCVPNRRAWLDNTTVP